MAQRYKFSIESKSFPLDISGEPKKLHLSNKGNKKAANRKGLAAQDRSVSYFFYGLYIYG